MTNRLYIARGIDRDEFHNRMREKYPQTEVEVVGVGVAEGCGILYDIEGIAVIASSGNSEAVSIRVIAKTIDEVGWMKRDISVRIGIELMPDRDGRRYEKFRRMR
jgi:hypothetical protein